MTFQVWYKEHGVAGVQTCKVEADKPEEVAKEFFSTHNALYDYAGCHILKVIEEVA